MRAARALGAARRRRLLIAVSDVVFSPSKEMRRMGNRQASIGTAHAISKNEAQSGRLVGHSTITDALLEGEDHDCSKYLYVE